MNVDKSYIKGIREQVLRWYSRHARDLPWRKTIDPYKIWLCEIIFQQTRIDQGLSYYIRFLEQFPTLERLAHAEETQVLKIWEGLGYYTRVRNLLKTAQVIYHQYGGHFPRTYEALLNLPGIGPYTASAIASICFNIPVPTMDGNVYRVLARVFELPGETNSQRFRQTARNIAEQLISPRKPGTFNQGMMDIGAIICTPTKPKCEECPLRTFCLAYRHGTQSCFPQRKPSRSVPVLYWIVGIIVDKRNHIVLTREQNRNFLKSLYALPTIEIPQIPPSDNTEKIFHSLAQEIHLPAHLRWEFVFQLMRKYSHRTIYFYVYKTCLRQPRENIRSPYQWVALEDIDQYPFSRAYSEIIKRYMGKG